MNARTRLPARSPRRRAAATEQLEFTWSPPRPAVELASPLEPQPAPLAVPTSPACSDHQPGEPRRVVDRAAAVVRCCDCDQVLERLGAASLLERGVELGALLADRPRRTS